MVIWGKKVDGNKFDGNTFSVSDMGRKKYSESTLYLKNIVFVEQQCCDNLSPKHTIPHLS